MDFAVRERRACEIRVVCIAEIDRIVRRRTVAIGISTINMPADRAARLNIDGIALRLGVRRRHIAAIDVFDFARARYRDCILRRIARARCIAAVDIQIRIVRIRDLDLVVRGRIAETRIAAIDRRACDVVRRRIGVLEAVDIRLDKRGSVFSIERMTIRLHMVLIVARRTLFAAGRIVADLHI